MTLFSAFRRILCACLLLLVFTGPFGRAQDPQKPRKFPYPQKLTYRIEWRLMTAGTANLEFTRSPSNGWQTNLNLESAGLVTRLYRVLDKYQVLSNEHFCPSNSALDAQEGKKHTITHLAFDYGRRKVSFDEQDMVKNTASKKELEVAPCTHEIMSALASLSGMDLLPGGSASVPITDGKKMVYARIEAQAKEPVNFDGRSYQTIRYEAFLFDNVLYKRKGRLLLWLTDDSERTPVQLRLHLGFPIGTISIQLEKQQQL